MPTLVLPEFPGTSEYRCVRSPLAGHEAVRVSTHQVDSGSSVQDEGESGVRLLLVASFWPSTLLGGSQS